MFTIQEVAIKHQISRRVDESNVHKQHECVSCYGIGFALVNAVAKAVCVLEFLLVSVRMSRSTTAGLLS